MVMDSAEITGVIVIAVAIAIGIILLIIFSKTFVVVRQAEVMIIERTETLNELSLSLQDLENTEPR